MNKALSKAEAIEKVKNPEKTPEHQVCFQGKVMALRGEVYRFIYALDEAQLVSLNPNEVIFGLSDFASKTQVMDFEVDHLIKVAIEAAEINIKQRLAELLT